jgi:hypothetical protein
VFRDQFFFNKKYKHIGFLYKKNIKYKLKKILSMHLIK